MMRKVMQIDKTEKKKAAEEKMQNTPYKTRETILWVCLRMMSGKVKTVAA
jgi:hypothetical protein